MKSKRPRLIDIKEVAEILGVEPYQVARLEQAGNFRRVKKTSKVWYCEDDIYLYLEKSNPFKELHMGLDEDVRFFDPVNSAHGVAFPWLTMTNRPYAVTNKGRVINLNTMQELKPYRVTHGYLQIGINRGRKTQEIRLHRLVAYLFCDNGKYKYCVHHIDGDTTNNNANNLIWLTQDEHRKADNLRRNAIKCGDWSEYNSFIAEMTLDNKWTAEQLKEGMWAVIEKERNSKGALISLVSDDAHEEVIEGKAVDETTKGKIHYQYWVRRLE